MNEPVCSGCYDNLCKTSYLADGQRLTRGAVARAHHHILCDLCRTVSYSYYNNKVNIIWRSAQTLTLFFSCVFLLQTIDLLVFSLLFNSLPTHMALSFIFLKCYYCNIQLSWGYQGFMLCQKTQMITCYQCSLHTPNRFNPNCQDSDSYEFTPFRFLNKISSQFFSLRLPQTPTLLKHVTQFLVTLGPRKDGYQPFYQPSRVYSTKDFIDSLEGNAFKGGSQLPISREEQFSIVCFPVKMVQLQSTCDEFYGFNIICIPVGEDIACSTGPPLSMNVFILHFNHLLCPVKRSFVKTVRTFFNRHKNKALKVSHFSWFVETQVVHDQPAPTLFIKVVHGTKFTSFFTREGDNFSKWDFISQLKQITWKADKLPSNINIKLASSLFKRTFTEYKEYCHQLAMDDPTQSKQQCICCLCQSVYPMGSEFRCKPRYTLANSIVYT